MLINFRFKNCRSFYDETVLSMQAVSNEFKELNTFTVEGKLMPKGENELLKSAVIFGSNASGKSNVLKALEFMKKAIQMSASQMPVIDRHEAFAFIEGAENEEALFEVEFIENGAYYKYGFAIEGKKIKSEWLDRREERLVHIFRRDGDNLSVLKMKRGTVQSISLSGGTLFLSVGRNFIWDGKPYIEDVITWFGKLTIVFEENVNSLDIYTRENGKYREQALRILKLADVGIEDIEVRKDKVAEAKGVGAILQLEGEAGQLQREDADWFSLDVATTFKNFAKDGTESGAKTVMLYKNHGFNSEGTERLLMYLGWILLALDQGRIIFIDEIDAKLHFLVADYLVRLFNSIDDNPKNAQLICTAHNLMIMDKDLRRDQIYFIGKDRCGKSSLMSLSDFNNVRKSDLFSKRYLAGFYADIPNMR